MTEEVKASEEVQEAKPFEVDLKKDVIYFYVGAEHEGRHLSILAKMKTYLAGEMVALLTERESAFVNSSSDSDALDLMAPGASEANRAFFDKHKIEISVREKNLETGVEGKLQVASDKVIDRLDALYKIRPLIIRYGYLNLVEEAITATGEFVLDEAFGDTIEKEFSFKVVDPDDGFKEKEVRARFVCRMPTAEDRRVWDQCAKTQALKKGGHRIRYNYSRIEHLANSMIVSVKSGFVLGGERLTDANREGRDGWLALLPYIFKYRLADSIFTLATEKNA